MQGATAEARPWELLLTDEDRAVLAAGGFGRRGGLGRRPALLVVDAQYGFVGLDAPILESVKVYPTSVGARAWRAVERIVQLRAAARAAAVPVLYSQSGTLPGEDAFDAFAPKVGAARTPGLAAPPCPPYAIVAAVAPAPGEVVIQKRFASAFFGTPLASFLRRLDVDSLVVCGFTTSGCVRATVVDAVSHGYPVVVAGDACADRLPLSHAVALLDIDTRYGDVVSAAEAAAPLGAGRRGEQ